MISFNPGKDATVGKTLRELAKEVVHPTLFRNTKLPALFALVDMHFDAVLFGVDSGAFFPAPKLTSVAYQEEVEEGTWVPTDAIITLNGEDRKPKKA